MLTRRSVLMLVPATILTYGLTPLVSYADTLSATQAAAQAGAKAAAAARARLSAVRQAPAALGVDEGRISPDELKQLGTALRGFFGEAPPNILGPKRGDLVSSKLIPGLGPSLFDKFWGIPGAFEKYRLPSGRLLLDGPDDRTRIDAIVVPQDSTFTAISAAALLTYLCPPGGATYEFPATHGRTFQGHLPCQQDYTLVIFYAKGTTPDPSLNADIRSWVQAAVSMRPTVIKPVGRTVMRTYVKVLGE